MTRKADPAVIPEETLTECFEISGTYPATFTNAAHAFRCSVPIVVVGVELITEQNGSGGGYTEVDVVAGAPGTTPASILSALPRVPGDGGVWGCSGVTAGGQAATVATANHTAGTIFSVNVTSGSNQPAGSAPSSATVVLKYRRQ